MLRRRSFSRRAWLLAGFIAGAMVLGGGGSGNPTTEVILQAFFAAIAIAWIWSGPRDQSEVGEFDRAILLLLPIPLIVPLLQLVPLPPSIWSSLPGRADAVAALQLVGEADSWRPISLSPARTLASLLAIIPPLFCLYATAALPAAERRLVLAAIGCIAVIAALLGAIQLVSPGGGLNLYRHFSLTWVTGFQANRNAAADVFLVGLLALAALAASQMARLSRGPGVVRSPASLILLAGAGLLVLAATVMTGSRAGIVLAVPTLLAAVAMLASGSSFATGPRVWAIVGLGAVALAGMLAALWHSSPSLSAAGRVLVRFSGLEDERWHVWEDTRYAIAQYWPAGSGMGTFGPVAFAVERLEVVNQTYPNRAHNDYLEIGLEAGIVGYLAVTVMALAAAYLAVRAWREREGRREQVIFAVGVLAILALHSLVDYPMRSMALACVAGVAGGMLARSPYRREPPVPAAMV